MVGLGSTIVDFFFPVNSCFLSVTGHSGRRQWKMKKFCANVVEGTR